MSSTRHQIRDNGTANPVKVVEYLSMDLPTVCSAVCEIIGTIEDGVDGLLVKPGDVEDLEEKLEWIIQNPERAKEVGENGRKKAIEKIVDIKKGKMKQQICIYGHYGWKNTGDDAMVYVLLRELHILYPTATFTILSQTAITVPPETKNLVKFVRRTPQTVFKESMHSSIFILGGGTHFYDHGIKIKALKILSKSFIVFILAKLFCKRIYFLGIGLEPLSTIWGRFLSKQIFQLADFISVRDR